jgi:hypothetical protein
MEKSRYLNKTAPSPDPSTTPIAPIAITDEVNRGRFLAAWQIATVVGHRGPDPKPLRKTKTVANDGENVKVTKKALTHMILIPINIAGQRVKRLGITVTANRPKISPIQYILNLKAEE